MTKFALCNSDGICPNCGTKYALAVPCLYDCPRCIATVQQWCAACHDEPADPTTGLCPNCDPDDILTPEDLL